MVVMGDYVRVQVIYLPQESCKKQMSLEKAQAHAADSIWGQDRDHFLARNMVFRRNEAERRPRESPTCFGQLAVLVSAAALYS